jgi:transcriptional regulator GlxA family with amidase domain
MNGVARQPCSYPRVDRQIAQMSPAEVKGARNALLVLIAGMIRATRTPDAGEAEFMPALRDQHRAFAATGGTVGSVVRAHRLAPARSDLVNTTSPIATIAHRCGFCDPSHLGREFRREFSMSPGDYREAYSIDRPPLT